MDFATELLIILLESAMPARASEFEEREFEAPLYNQLECGTRLVWSPGQVFEHYIGIDRALFLYDPMLWRFFGVGQNPAWCYPGPLRLAILAQASQAQTP